MILSDSALAHALKHGDLAVVDELGISGSKTAITAEHLDEDGRLQPASIDLNLGTEFAYWETEGEVINFANSADHFPRMKVVNDRSVFAVPPRGFALATTLERVKIGVRYLGRIEGRSSLGRVGLLVHSTAGFVDPGWDGQITLELYNLSPHWMQCVPGQGICQLAIEEVAGAVKRPYGHAGLRSKYFRQKGVTLSRWKGKQP